MTKVQTIISEINELNLNELEVVLKEILRRIDRKRRIEAALDKIIGLGQGVWDSDAQKHIDSLRQEDRL
jgi:hypothetical protein